MSKPLSTDEIYSDLEKTVKQIAFTATNLLISLVLYVQNSPKIMKEGKKQLVEPGESKIRKSPITKIPAAKRLTQVIYQYQQDRESGEKRNYNRHTEFWEVRGHYRTYKSGKRVWVKPSVKGNKEKAVSLGHDYKL